MYLNYIRQLRRADHSSRGMVCPESVIAKPHKGRSWLRLGSKRHKKKFIEGRGIKEPGVNWKKTPHV